MQTALVLFEVSTKSANLSLSSISVDRRADGNQKLGCRKFNITISVSCMSNPASTRTVSTVSVPSGRASAVSQLCPPHVKPDVSSACLKLTQNQLMLLSSSEGKTNPIASRLTSIFMGRELVPLRFRSMCTLALLDAPFKKAWELMNTARTSKPLSQNAQPAIRRLSIASSMAFVEPECPISSVAMIAAQQEGWT